MNIKILSKNVAFNINAKCNIDDMLETVGDVERLWNNTGKE